MSPSRPSPLLGLTNAAMAPLARNRDPERAWQRLTDSCMKATGTVPHGPAVDALRKLLGCYAVDPNLSPLGWYSAQQVQVGPRLRNMALVQQQLRQVPAIAREDVDDPIIIVGLPRTGTTLAHRLLAAARGHRGPLMAELYETRHHYTDWPAQVARAERQITMLGWYEPWFTRDIHPMDAQASEETFICEAASVFFLCSADLPTYRAWLMRQDATPWYVWLRQVLQVLQYGKARRRWVLKQPGHLWHLEVIRRVFPQATFVWNHRDPATVFGSTCSMVEAMRRMHQVRAAFAPKGLHRIGRTWLHLLAEGIERGRTAAAQLPREAVVDVAYHRLVAERDTALPELYERLGIAWTSEDRARLDAAFSHRDASRAHDYTTHRYGYQPDEVEAAFGDYPTMVHRFNAGAF